MRSPNRYQRLGAPELLGRAIVATVAGGLMTAGAYPLLPALIGARARGESLFLRLARRDLLEEWSIGVASSMARPLGFGPLPGHRGQGPRPIVLVHGYAMGRSSFIPLAARLAEAGLGPIIGFEYWSLGSLAESARRLGRVIDRALAETGAERVDLVGHSMGGVISRYFVALEEGAGRVRQLITLGSPHAGSEISLFAAGSMRRELRRGSATLARLANAPIPDDVALTIVHSRIDVLAGSLKHTAIEGAEVLRFDDVGHMGLLVDSKVTAAVRQRLSQ